MSIICKPHRGLICKDRDKNIYFDFNKNTAQCIGPMRENYAKVAAASTSTRTIKANLKRNHYRCQYQQTQ